MHLHPFTDPGRQPGRPSRFSLMDQDSFAIFHHCEMNGQARFLHQGKHNRRRLVAHRNSRECQIGKFEQPEAKLIARGPDRCDRDSLAAATSRPGNERNSSAG